MDYASLVQDISKVGFPIAACVALFWQNHRLAETINNNTAALIELRHRLEGNNAGHK